MLRGLGITLGVWALGAGAIGLVILQPEVCPPVSTATLEASAASAVGWFEEALLDDGRYVYEWNGETDEFSADYNEVRHAGVTMSLYQRAMSGDEEALRIGDAGLEWMLANLERLDNWAALKNPNSDQMKLGASSLMAAGLLLRREATGDEQYDDLLREISRFLVTLQRPDGSFLNFFDLSTGAPVPGVTSKYATGEAFWALAMMHNTFPADGWDGATWRVADYLALYRDEVEDFDYPPWADQWAAYGLSEMVDWGLGDHHIEYAKSIAGRFGLLIRSESQRRDDFYSHWTRGPEARAAGLGTWVEGLNSLWRVAESDERMRDLLGDIEERATCGAGMLVHRQVTADEAEDYARPELAEGAWFDEGLTRMDDQQHALSGLILTLEHLEGRGSE